MNGDQSSTRQRRSRSWEERAQGESSTEKKTSWEDREPMDHRTPRDIRASLETRLSFGLASWSCFLFGQTRKPRFDPRANTSCSFWFIEFIFSKSKSYFHRMQWSVYLISIILFYLVPYTMFKRGTFQSTTENWKSSNEIQQITKRLKKYPYSAKTKLKPNIKQLWCFSFAIWFS